MEKIAITGATGLVGTQLIPLLQQHGYDIILITRKKNSHLPFQQFEWDVDKNYLEEGALNDVHHIIHLAGANIGEKRWTQKRKKELYSSRVEATKLLAKNANFEHLKTFISSSGTAWCGTYSNGQINDENSPFGNDYLAQLTKSWEEAAAPFNQQGIRTVFVRTSLVLSRNGGALPKMITPIKYGLGSPIGSGKQLMPWIHIDDLCNLFIWTLKNQNIEGPVNAVAPEIISNKEFTLEVASVVKKKVWLPHVPGWILKIIFGEMASLLLHGNHVISAILPSSNFQFQYPNLNLALKHLFSSEKS